jgi:hypothetical protein
MLAFIFVNHRNPNKIVIERKRVEGVNFGE